MSELSEETLLPIVSIQRDYNRYKGIRPFEFIDLLERDLNRFMEIYPIESDLQDGELPYSLSFINTTSNYSLENGGTVNSISLTRASVLLGFYEFVDGNVVTRRRNFNAFIGNSNRLMNTPEMHQLLHLFAYLLGPVEIEYRKFFGKGFFMLSFDENEQEFDLRRTDKPIEAPDNGSGRGWKFNGLSNVTVSL